MAVGVEIGVLIVSGGVPRVAPLEALTARRHVEVESQRRGSVSITPRRRADGCRIHILRDAEYVVVVSGFLLGEQREFVIPQRKCFDRRQEKAGDGKGSAHDLKPRAGAALRAADRSHSRLRSKTRFALQESISQACHGALEMGSGSAKASCESGFDRSRPFTRHTATCGDARWRSRRAAPPIQWPNCRAPGLGPWAPGRAWDWRSGRISPRPSPCRRLPPRGLPATATRRRRRAG